MISVNKICFLLWYKNILSSQTESLDFVQLLKWAAQPPDKYTNNDKWYTFLSFAPKLRFHPRQSTGVTKGFHSQIQELSSTEKHL